MRLRHSCSLISLMLMHLGCAAMVTTQPTTPLAYPLPPAHRVPWPLTVAIVTKQGGGSYPCDHLSATLAERLRDQQLFATVQEPWGQGAADLTFTVTFVCTFDSHESSTFVTNTAVGMSMFMLAGLPLFDWDYTLQADLRVSRQGQLLRTYPAQSQWEADYNHWVQWESGWEATFMQQAEDDLIAHMITALIADSHFWGELSTP
jgi:hypothetical protein